MYSFHKAIKVSCNYLYNIHTINYNSLIYIYVSQIANN